MKRVLPHDAGRERALALYRRVLELFPYEFRARHGDSMARAVADAWDHEHRTDGAFKAWRGYLISLFDAGYQGVLEHLVPSEPEPDLRRPFDRANTSGGPMEALIRDVRYACRGLVRRPAFTLTAVLTLAVAIGFNTVLFSLVRGVLLDPLPYPDSERLVVLQSVQGGEDRVEGMSALDFQDFHQRAELLEDMAAFQYYGLTYAGGDKPIDVPSMLVTPELFSVLGVEAALGRTFLPEEGVSGRDNVVVVSHEFWQSELGGADDVIGRVLELDAEPTEVVGVMPPGFEFPPEHDARLWAALSFQPGGLHEDRRQVRSLGMLARIRNEAGLEPARQELARIAAGLAEEYPDTNAGWSVQARALHEQVVGTNVRTTLLALFGAVGLLLLIACANLANLTLSRLAARQREIAVRTGLGAARRHLLRQLLSESVLLAVVGGLAGLGLAAFGLVFVRRLPAEVLPRLGQVELDAGVVTFTFGLCLLTALAFGLMPAWKACRADLADRLRHRSSSSFASQRLFGGLVVCQVVLTLVLIVGAGLMVRSFTRLTAVDPGFDADSVLAANIFLPRAKYTEDHQKKAFYDAVLADLADAPGIRSVAAVTSLPLDEVGINFDLPFTIDDRPPLTKGEEPQADFRVATPEYFNTLGIPVVRGRGFDERDREDATAVMLINQTMARRHFPGEDPIGRFVTLPGSGRCEVIGVVGDLKHYGLASETRPEVYVPFAQRPFGGMTIVARTSSEPLAYGGTVARAVAAADPSQAVYRFSELQTLLDQVLLMPRLNMAVLALFALCSCLLAALGIYGVMTSMVAERTQEIGVRLALGARSNEVLWMVVRRGMALALGGIAGGFVASAALTRLLESLLFEVDPLDPAVLALAGVVFALVALAANLVPAVRAMRVDPATVLAAD